LLTQQKGFDLDSLDSYPCLWANTVEKTEICENLSQHLQLSAGHHF